MLREQISTHLYLTSLFQGYAEYLLTKITAAAWLLFRLLHVCVHVCIAELGKLVKLSHIHYFQMSCSSKNKVAIQIAQAVLFLHSAKPPTVHLDIKPANILVSHF